MNSPDNHKNPVRKLSPAKQALLEKRLRGESADHDESGSIPRRPDPQAFPLSFAQERFWFLDQFEPGCPAHNRPLALRLSGPLNVTVLEQALGEILRRHEALRAVFSNKGGQPAQTILPARPIHLPVTDISECPSTERESAVLSLAAEEAQRSVDLSRGPLLRATLVRLSDEEHVLILVIHHIAFDAWSAKVLMGELAALYESFVHGVASPLADLPIQYADFAHWQRQSLRAEVLETQLSYWKKKLDHVPPSLNVPTDHPRPSIQSHRGARHILTLPSSLVPSLKALSQREGVTLFMALLAAFKILLRRYTGQDDIVVGSPLAGRTHVDTEGLIGFFIKPLVLRTDLSGNPRVRELLGRVREVAMEAYAHQDIPFEKLVEKLQPERHLSRSPFFQVAFNLENIPDRATEARDLHIEELEFDSGIQAIDVILEIIEKEGTLTCLFTYNTDLFHEQTVKRMGFHFQTLLEGIAADPDQPIGTIPLLTEAERHQLLVEWNNTAADYPQDACIHHLFEAQVERTPETVAVVSGNQQLTYRELNTRANQLAHHLRKLGVGPETFVGICLERSVEMVTGILGILKAGGAYVPLDPAYPLERLAFILSDTRLSVLLTQQSILESLPEHEARVVRLDTDWPDISRERSENPDRTATANHLAYVIYTSGTTGTPKGVPIEHRGLCNLITSDIRTCGIGRGDRFLHIVSFSFDAATCHMFKTLCSGASLYIASRKSLSSASSIIHSLRDLSITHIHMPASLLCALPLEDLFSLKTMVIGAEVCPPDVAARWAKGRRLFNAYGPTETTIRATLAEYHAGDGRLSIGRPIPNTQAYILDRHLQPVPIGVPGELHIGGVGLARGYLNQPELTAKRFIPNPFSDEPGSRLYKTGDLARYLPDGNIEYLGRVDHQVKIRGFRIEPGEVEFALRQHPAVSEAVVTARECEPGDRRLVAYVVLRKSQAHAIAGLRSFLKEMLPENMVPSVFVPLDSLPLTPHGKVDRRALPVPDWSRSESDRPYIAPRDDLEIQLTTIWERLLSVKPIGIRDNFFDLGGHSLLAVRLFAEIKKEMGINMPLSTLFQGPTVEELAHVIRQGERKEPWSSLVPVQSRGNRIPIFCVAPAANEAIGFASLVRHLDPDQPFYGLKLPEGDTAPRTCALRIWPHTVSRTSKRFNPRALTCWEERVWAV